MPTNTDLQNFRRNVQALRKAKGLTQEQLAEKIGKSVDTVSNIERGFLSTRLQTASDIATALDTDLAGLFRGQPHTDEEKRRQELADRILRVVEKGDDEALNAIDQLAQTILHLRDR